MKHFPASRPPARLTGLSDQLTCADDSRRLTTRAWLAVTAAVFSAGLALGVVGYAFANLHGLLP